MIFSFVDQVRGLATSAKTMDPRRKAYTVMRGRAFSKLRRDIEKIAGFRRYELPSYRVSAAAIRRRRLELAVPADVSQVHIEEIAKAQMHAMCVGVEMEVTLVRG